MARSALLTWLKRQSRISKAPVRREVRRGQLHLETLEDRTLLNATVTSVSTPLAANTFLVTGQTATITVNFSEKVDVSTANGTPTLKLNMSGFPQASYSGGSGTTALQFSYVVQDGDSTAANPLDYVNPVSLTLNGGSITDDPADGDTSSATLELRAPATANDLLYAANILVNAPAPAAVTIDDPIDSGSYGPGDTLTFNVYFNENATVDTTNGTPRLTLSDGQTATYSSGSGSKTLVFTYTIGAGDTTNGSALDVSSINLNGSTIQNAIGQDANLNFLYDSVPDHNIIIDPNMPTVSSVATSAASGIYGWDAPLAFQVTFNQPVDVTGTPQLMLSDGQVANYASGSGTNTLTFQYSVGSGNTTNGAALDVTAISLNGGTIESSGGEEANLRINNDQVASKNVVIDGTTPVVTAVTTSTSSGVYATGASITIRVTFSEAVQVSGSPTLTLSDGKTASYTSGNGTTTLVFTYLVADGDTTDGSALDISSINLNLGNIESLGETVADLTIQGDQLPSKNVVIDTSTPTVQLVDAMTAAGTYGVGSTIFLVVGFSENVFVTGAPTLALSDGATATYAGGSGTNTLTFAYVVRSGDTTNGQPLDFASTSALSLTGGTIRNAAETAAMLTLPAPGSSNDFLAGNAIVIDGVVSPSLPLSPPTTNLSDQVQQLIQDMLAIQQELALEIVPAFSQTLQRYELFLVTVEQQLIPLLLNDLSQLLTHSQQVMGNLPLPIP